MPNLPGIHHQRAIKAFQKVGYTIVRQGRHTILSDGSRVLVIPRHDPINGYTLGGLVQDAGLSIDEFRKLL